MPPPSTLPFLLPHYCTRLTDRKGPLDEYNVREHQNFSIRFPGRSRRAVVRRIAKLRRAFIDEQAELNGTPDTAGLSLSEAVIRPWTDAEINTVFDHYNEPRIIPPHLSCLLSSVFLPWLFGRS